MAMPQRLPIKERILTRVVVATNGCWNYQGQVTPEGYGILKYAPFKETLAHRVSFMVFKSEGLSIKSLCVCHTCDNPICLNPEHLFIGTRDDNNKDRSIKGRTRNSFMTATHCKRGHPFDEINTHIRPNGTRTCRKCNAELTRLKRYKNDNAV